MSDVALINVDDNVYRMNETICSQTLDSAAVNSDWSVRMTRLHGGLSDGVDVIRIDNGLLSLDVLPTRGMGLWRGSLQNIPVGWDSPVKRPVHPSFVDQHRRGGIGWLDGFHEMLVRCGLGWNGAPGTDVRVDADGNELSAEFLTLHGRIANLAAHQVDFEITAEGALQLTGIVDEASLFGGHLRLTSTLSTFPNSHTFQIRDTVTNLGAQTAECEMLYHCNFGPPFADTGSQFVMATHTVAPRDDRAAEDVDAWQSIAGPQTGYTEQVYFAAPVSKHGRAFACLKNQAADRAIGIRFRTETLPLFSLWKNTQDRADGYCVGLEPATGFPNLRSFEREQQRVISLEPSESRTFDLSVSIAIDAETVMKWDREVQQMQSVTTQLHKQPRPDWTPGV